MKKTMTLLLIIATLIALVSWKKYQDNIFGGTGDMNILAVPRTKIQPDNFPKLQSENELWDGDLYLKFYSDKQIPLV